MVRAHCLESTFHPFGCFRLFCLLVPFNTYLILQIHKSTFHFVKPVLKLLFPTCSNVFSITEENKHFWFKVLKFKYLQDLKIYSGMKNIIIFIQLLPGSRSYQKLWKSIFVRTYFFFGCSAPPCSLLEWITQAITS